MQHPSNTRKICASGTRGVSSIGGRNVLSSGRSSSLSRLSGASQGRFSEGGQSQLKDPRPVTDKAFLSECAEKILKFCSTNEYKTTHLSKSALVNPSLKDFFGIFEFLSLMMKGSFKYSAKPEDEIPKIVKQLRYPFTINRSMLLGLGNRKTWGCLLGLLVWMIDLIELCYEADIRFYMDGTEDEFSGEFKELLLDGVAERYKEYLQTGEVDDTRDADIYYKFAQMYVKQGNLEQLQELHQRLEDQHEELTKKFDELLSQEKYLEGTAQDIERLEQYLIKMDSYLVSSKEKCKNDALQIKAFETEIEPLRKERDRLQAIISQQAAEANQYKLAIAKRDAAKEQYETARAMAVKLENAITDKEVKCCNAWKINQKLIKELEDIDLKTKNLLKLCNNEEANAINAQLAKFQSESNPSDFLKDVQQCLTQSKTLLLWLNDKNMQSSNAVMNAEMTLNELMEYFKEIELEENNIRSSLDAEKLKDIRSDEEYENALNLVDQALKEMDEKVQIKQSEELKMIAAQKIKVQALEAKLAEWEQKIPEYENECELVLKKVRARIEGHYEERAKKQAEYIANTKDCLKRLMS